MKIIDGFPRRNRLDLNTPAELAIYNAMAEVEKCGASESLTKAVTLLEDAKNALADHIEGIEPQKQEEGENNIRLANILSDYYRRNDYDIIDAVADINRLFDQQPATPVSN